MSQVKINYPGRAPPECPLGNWQRIPGRTTCRIAEPRHGYSPDPGIFKLGEGWGKKKYSRTFIESQKIQRSTNQENPESRQKHLRTSNPYASGGFQDVGRGARGGKSKGERLRERE